MLKLLTVVLLLLFNIGCGTLTTDGEWYDRQLSRACNSNYKVYPKDACP